MTEQSSNPHTMTVTVDSKQYTIDSTKMPYFASHASTTTHDALPHFDTAFHCVEHGFHTAFQKLGTDLSTYPALCNTLNLLGVDVQSSRTLAEIITACKTFRFDDERSKIKSTNLATDSVFALLYMHHTGAIGVRDRNRVFDAVVFIIAHRYFFGHRTRSVVRETYKMMGSTPKQLAVIEQWPVYGSDGRPLEPLEKDDEEGDNCYSDEESEKYFLTDEEVDDCYSDEEREEHLQTWGHY